MAGTVQGVALAPGVSRNGRLYTKENIAKAYQRLSARLKDPNGSPVVMRTHHAAGDDSTRIVAQVKSVSLDSDGKLLYTGEFANTPHAQTIRELSKAKTGKPALAHVSIYGWWMDEPVTQVLEDGTKVETADDLEINAIDFTHSPGVINATAASESHRAQAIHESHEAEITVTEASTATIAETASTFADPGYAGEKRWPLSTAAETVAAWCAVNTASTVESYTGPQVKRMKTRIKTAAKKNGATISDSWIYAEGNVSEFYADIYGVEVGGNEPATFSFNATNGPISVSISSYCIDPADLEVVTKAACAAIAVALQSIDPDMDGDIDLPGADAEDTDSDNNMESTHTSDALSENAATEAETTTEKEPLVAENTTETAAATEAAPVVESAPAAPTFDYKALAEAFASVLDARDAAKATAETVSTETAVTETEDATADKANLQEGLKAAVRDLLIESGELKPSRKGYGATDESDAVSKEQLWENRGQIFTAFAREQKNS